MASPGNYSHPTTAQSWTWRSLGISHGVDVEVLVETPKGSHNKYEFDQGGRAIWLSRTLFTAMQFPVDYGYIPGTLAPDGDPLDALVLLDEPTFPGCHVRGRVVAVLRMRDQEGDDDKIVVVPSNDPRWADVTDVTDLAVHLKDEISHFFDVYKDLEPEKWAEPSGWAAAQEAETIIDRFRHGGQ